MYKGRRNYITLSTVIPLITIAILFVIRFIPSNTLFGIELRKADIIADVVAIDTTSSLSACDNSSVSLVEGSGSLVSMEAPRGRRHDRKRRDSIDTPVVTDHKTDSVIVDSSRMSSIKADSGKTMAIVPIEDYSPNGDALNAFRAAVARRGGDVVRIGVMGDSFIEGDLLTADLREALQSRLGGSGVGFVPVTSIVSKLRQTVTHKFSGWTTHSIKKRNSADIDSRFLISGYLYTPNSENATVSYRTTHFKKHLGGVNRVDFFFVNRKNTEIYATVNDSTELIFTPPSDDNIQKITINSEETVSSIKFNFKNIDGFIAYGASMGGYGGIEVDNFGDRGSSGLQMSKLRYDCNSRFNDLNTYDLIIVEYGLNVVAKGTMRYTNFEDKMSDIITNIKRCYPTASIIIMGMSDRSSNQQGEYRTMPEAKAMMEHQRQIARRAGVAYWDTFTAMGGENSMKEFVRKRWASKDYTHVSGKGASYIAERLADSIMDAL